MQLRQKMSEKLYWLRVIVGVFAVLAAQWASACDLCAIYSASRARAEVGAGVFTGVAEQFTHFGTLQFEGSEIPNPAGQYLDSSISQVFSGYNFNNRFGLQLNLPVIYRSFRRPDELGSIQQGTVSGIGDLALLGNFVAYNKLTERYTVTWSVLGGLKFPTGDTSRLKEEFNEMAAPAGPPSGIHGHDLTLGTGSYDGIIGTSVFGRLANWYATALVQYAIRTEGDYSYRFADDLTWSGGPGYYLFLKDRFTLGLQLLVSGEDKGLDRFQGAAVADTGITAVYLGPQLSFTWGSNLSAQAGVDIPVLLENTSLQIVPDYRVRAAFSWHF